MSFNEKLSYTEHVVTTPATDFGIGFKDYGGDSDIIKVTVDDVIATEAGYTVFRKNALTIALEPAVTSGVVRLQRETNIDSSFYRFTAGAKFVAANVDANFEQILHSQQETRDGFNKLASDVYPLVNGLEEALQKADSASRAAQEAAEAAEEAAQVTRSASQVIDESGKTQQEINSKTLFLSDYLTEPATFFAAQDKNRVVDVFELPTTDTLNFQGSLDFKNLEIKAASDFPANKKPMIVLGENCIAQNLILNGGLKNVRGASLNSSNISIKNLTIKNTQYLALEGNSEVAKFNLDLDNIRLENVCTSGVAGDLGYGGLSIERSFNGSFNNITVDSCGAKAFRLRYSENNTGRKHKYNDVRGDQAAIYLASGANNNISEVVITGTRNCVKISRGEKNSKVDFLDLDNSHISDATYTVALLLQGTQDCEVSDMRIRKGSGAAIRVEPHPAEAADPYAEQPSYRNKLKNITVDAVGSGDLLYSTRSAGLQEMKGNEYENIVLRGNDVATSGVTLQRSSETVMRNVNVLDVLGSDIAATDSELDFIGGSLVSNNATTSRKITFGGVSFASFEGTKISGSTTNARYISADIASGKFQLINCSDVETVSSDYGIYVAGSGSTVNMIGNNLKGNRVVIGNNISGGIIANNVTAQAIYSATTTVTLSNNVTPSTTALILKNQVLPATSSVPVGKTVNTEFTVTGAKLGDIVRVTPIANFSSYDTMDIVGVVRGVDTVMVKRKNTSSAPIDMPTMSVNIQVDRL